MQKNRHQLFRTSINNGHPVAAFFIAATALLYLLFAPALANAQRMDLPVYKNTDGQLAFVIDSSDSQRALRTIAVAQQLLEDGLPSTIIFDKSGVLLTVRHKLTSFHEPSSPIRVLTQREMDDMGSPSQQKADLEKILYRETKGSSHLNKLWAITAREQVTSKLDTYIELGGKVIVCSKCLNKFGFAKMNLVHTKISVDPVKFEQTYKGIPRN